MSNSQQVSSIVIVGGGTSGWMTAAALGKHFNNTPVKITLIESSQMGTIGVGEATIPTLRRFYQRLGLSDTDVLKASAATCKLGIEFVDWYKQGTSFIHPFGIYGQSTKEVGFHHYWLRSKHEGGDSELAQYSLGVQLAKHNKFMFPQEKPESQLEVFDWALHFDAALFAKLMKQNALSNGVELIDEKIVNVNLDKHNQDIASVRLESGKDITADLFVDCSGFKSMLLQETLNTGYEDWSQWLFCDSAVAVQTKLGDRPLARTQSIAHKAGWQWKIPLQHRQGNGHVYSSRYIDKEQATETLLANIEDNTLHEPRHFTFTPGRATRAWNKNCVAIGLSSGFLEPLESTSIALVQTAIEKLVGLLQQPCYNDETQAKFNDATIKEYERVRDFIIVHYKLNKRDDSDFWRDCQQISPPHSLEEKLNIYLNSGDVQRLNWEIFGKDSWLAIFDGFKYYPKSFDVRANSMNKAYLEENLTYMKQRVSRSLEQAMDHEEFLHKYCQYQT